jgi:RsmE family RNA methyltransferase
LCCAQLNTHQRLERALQKCTEIGAKRLAIVQSQYSPEYPLNAKKVDRANTIMREALEQSHGRHMPELHVYT